MLFKQIFDIESCTYTYLIASGYGREALIIDPVRDMAESYVKLINELDLRLVLAIDTHVHADHITAIGPLCKHIEGCQSAMGAHSKAEHLDIHLKEGETLNVDGIKFTNLYTPGHTDDSYSYLMNDRVFTGDTLLIRGTGRTDFQNGSSEQQYDSLFNKLLTLPDKTLVYPAHDYKGQTVSTIGEEKQCNPRLQVSNKQEYVDMMNQLKLSDPKKMDIAIPANLKCGLNDSLK